MKRAFAAALLLTAVPVAHAGAGALTAAERARAQGLPHYATAGVRLPDGSVGWGSLVIAAYDDGRVRVELAASDGVQGELALTGPEVADDGALRERFRAPAGPTARYANHGTLAVPGRGRSMSVLRSDLRMDGDGLFALDLEGQGADGATVALAVFGRALGVCWANERGTLKRVTDLSKRPDCRRLFGGL